VQFISLNHYETLKVKYVHHTLVIFTLPKVMSLYNHYVTMFYIFVEKIKKLKKQDVDH
jgi:hypothetical protein